MPILLVGLPFTLAAMIISSLEGGRITGAVTFLCGIAATIIGIKLFRRQHSEASEHITLPDCRVFEELVTSKATNALNSVCLELGGKTEVALLAAIAAEQLIEMSSDTELHQLSREATGAICSAMIHGPLADDHLMFRDAGLHALAVAGNESDLRKIEKWLAGVEARDGDLNKMQMFHERIERERLTNTLLRPSTKNDSQLLLRPSGYCEIDPAQLLRPTTDATVSRPPDET